MKRLNLLYTIGLPSLFLLGIFLIVLIYLRRIELEIYSLVSVYGYFAILIIAFVVDILLQPIGPEVPLFAAKIIDLDTMITVLLVILGSTLATFFSYKMGKIFYPRVCKEKKCKKYLELYQKYGKYGLLIAALGPVPYVPFCWFTGAFGSPIKQLIYFGIIPRTLRIIFVSSILFFIF